jgi:hypothetical protein
MLIDKKSNIKQIKTIDCFINELKKANYRYTKIEMNEIYAKLKKAQIQDAKAIELHKTRLKSYR